MTQLLEWDASVPSMVAASQQLMLIGGNYQNRLDVVLAYLGEDGKILGSRHEPTSWNPSWVVVRSGRKRYFVSFSGTVNPQQAIGQATNINLQTPNTSGDGYAGSFWQRAWDLTASAILELIDTDDPESKIYVSGHSMGGAVAQIMANGLAVTIGRGRIQCMTFGQPRTYSSGRNDSGDAPSARFYSLGDQIPNIPSDTSSWFLGNFLDPRSWLYKYNTWQHYGYPVPLAADCEIADKPQYWNPLADDVSDDPTREHGLANYGGRVGGWLKRHGADPAGIRAIQALNVMLAGGSNQVVVDAGLNEQLRLPEETYNLLERTINGRGGDATSVIRRGGMPCRLTLTFFGRSGESWTEVYARAGDSPTSAVTLSDSLLNARLALLWTGHTLQSARASFIGLPRQSSFNIYQKPGLARGNVDTDTGDLTGVSAVVTLYAGENGRYSRKLWLRGLLDLSVQRDPVTGLGTLGADADKALRTYIKALADNGFGIIPRVRPTEAGSTAYIDIGQFAPSGATGLTTITTTRAHSFITGMVVRISGADAKKLPGMNGEYQISNAGGAVFDIRYTMPSIIVVPGGGARARENKPMEIQAIQPAFSKFGWFTPRKTRSPFSHSRGARRAPRIRLLV